MATKKTNKSVVIKTKIGNVVGIAPNDILEQFKFNNRLRSEAHNILSRISESEGHLWHTLEQLFFLEMEKYLHQVNNKTGEITIISLRKEKKENG